MCGIHGFAGPVDTVSAMVRATRHRGPDGSGVWSDTAMTLGHNLLAVRAAPDGSRQPVVGERSVLVYNGELYPAKPIPEKMCDTGVLAAALDTSDVAALDGLNAMYALANYTPGSGHIMLARDRSGAKPLYYGMVGGRLAFSSEIRGMRAAGLQPSLDPIGVRLYLRYGHVPGPRTLLAGVSKLTPGERRLYRLPGTLVSSRQEYVPVADTKFTAEGFRSALAESVRRCLPSVRRVGVFLSGGLDSTAVLWGLREAGASVETLTTRFRDDDEEAAIASKAAAYCGATHREHFFSEADYLPYMTKAIAAHDEPVANKGMPVYIAAHERAEKYGWTVVFTGDGGDELMGGYGRHTRVASEVGRPVEVWDRLTGRDIPAGLFRQEADSFDFVSYAESWMPAGLLERPSGLRTQLEMEGLCHLPEEYLIRNDKFGMSFGLECRAPMLYEPFRSYALGIVDKLTDGKADKRHIRDALRGRVPEAVTAKPKTGWSPPLGLWLNGKSAFAGPVGAAIDAVVRPGRCPAVDQLIDVATARSSIKLTLALFYLILWAEHARL